ncbi:MAG: IS630 family transposase [Planctomycetota bacterium]
MHAAEQDRPDVAERRAAWRLIGWGLDPRRLVFIDETWCKTNMTRLRGRSLVGRRLVAKVPYGHWKTTTLVAALGHRGMCCGMTVDGPVNGDVFVAFCERVLGPTLRPGDVVVMDNLSAHKVAGVREAIEAVGAEVLYLPPYSPDLNPIELAFSKLKSLMRSAGHRAVDALWGDTQRLLDAITPSDAAGFFKHCGYPLQME